MKGATARAVFLDKDGTLVENVPYNVDHERILLTPGAADALRTLASAGYLIVVVSDLAVAVETILTAPRLRPSQAETTR